MSRHKLLFKNLNLKATPAQLLKLASQAGEVRGLRIFRDPILLRSLGAGIIEMKTFHEAITCIDKLNGSHFMGRTLCVSWSSRAFPLV